MILQTIIIRLESLNTYLKTYKKPTEYGVGYLNILICQFVASLTQVVMKHKISTRNSQNCSSTAEIYSRSESFQKLKFSKVNCSKKWDKVSNESTEHKLRK